MSKISTYQVAPVPKLADKLIGTSVGGEIQDITYNFTLQELLNLFLPVIPANNLQGILDYGNTATQDINLFGTINTTNLNVTDTTNLFITYLNEEVHIVGSLFDSADSVGTPGQVLSSTGSGVEWYTLPPIFTPTLQQVLTEGNTATTDILLDANIQALDVSSDTATVSSNFTLDGTLTDGTASVGASGKILSSTGAGVQWIDLPVYSATSPLLFNSGTGVFSIQVANSIQSGYLTNSDWISFDGKQNAGNYITDLTGEATASGPGSAAITLNNASVISKVLTGLSITGGPITATDSILSAFGKVQNQLDNTVSSVGLSMPSAFNVANSPITSSGTLAVTAAGVASQYIRGDGTLADFPTGGGGGGSSVSYYLNGSINQGTFVGDTYNQMNKTPVFGTGTDFTISSDGYIAQFITDINDPNSLLIPAGNWNLEMYFNASSSGGTPSFYTELYKYDGTTFTLIASNSTNPEFIAFGTIVSPYFSNMAVPETVLLDTDRIAIRVYVSNSGKTITLHTEDSNLCQVITTFTTGLQSLNGLSKQTQYFAVGTSGNDFGISSTGNTHTFNLPSASEIARGVVTTLAQSFEGAKTFRNGDGGEITLDRKVLATSRNVIKYTTNNAIKWWLGPKVNSENFQLYNVPGAGPIIEVDATSNLTTFNFAILGSNAEFNGNLAIGTTVNNDVKLTIVDTDTPASNSQINFRSTQFGSTMGSLGNNNDYLYLSNNIYNSGAGNVYTDPTKAAGRIYINSGVAGSTIVFQTSSSVGTFPVNALSIAVNQNITAHAAIQILGNTLGTTANFTGQLTLGSTITNGTYTYTLPSATGTLALTSALSSYLPLSGGILTGALNGTSASFSGNGAFGTISGNLEVGYGGNQGLYKIDVNGTARIATSLITPLVNINGVSMNVGGMFGNASGSVLGVGGDLLFKPSASIKWLSNFSVYAINAKINAVGYTDGSWRQDIEIWTNINGSDPSLVRRIFIPGGGSGANSYANLGGVNIDQLTVNGISKVVGQLTLNSTITNGTSTYTLPSATGTLALTSDLGSYLPLSGGTLTGTAIWNTAGIATDFQNTSYIRFSNSGGASRWGYIQHDGTDLAFVNDISAGKFTFNKQISGTSATFSGLITGSAYFNATSLSGYRIRNSTDTANAGGFTRRGLWEGNANYDPALWAETGYGLYFYTNGSATPVLTIATTGAATFSSDVRSNGIFRDYQGEALLQTSGSETQLGSTAAGTPRSFRLYTGNTTALTISTAGAATFSSSVTATNGLIDNNLERFVNPGGARYSTQTGSVTGAWKIALPAGSQAQPPMLQFTINIYSYSTGLSHQIRVGGHFSGASWYNVFAYSLTDAGVQYTARFGYDGTRICVWIGELSSVWSYPQVFVTDFQNGFAGISSLWASDWYITPVTSFDAVTNTRTATLALNTNNYNSYAPTLTGGGASGTWGINITGNASTVTVNSGNTTAGWYPVLWHSSNTIYSTPNVEIYGAGGYIRAQYFNSTDSVESSITSFVIKNGDNYHRSASTTTAADIIRGVASGTWGINVTGYSTQLNGYANQTLYTILDGPANGPVIKVRYDSATANRYIDIGSKDGNGVYTEGFKIYNGGTPTWQSNTILHAGNYNSYSPTLTGGGASGTWGINVTGTSGSISGFNNPTTTATANTIAYRDSNAYIYAAYFNAPANSASPSTSGLTSMIGRLGASDKFYYDFTAGAVRTFLQVTSDTYTPTLTDNTGGNVTSLVAQQAMYTRVGDTVTVNGQISFNFSVGSGEANILVSLPIASDIQIYTDVLGVGAGFANQLAVYITGSAAANTAVIRYGPTSASNVMNFSFMYKIK